MVARGLRSARCHLRSQFRCFLTPLSNYLTSTIKKLKVSITLQSTCMSSTEN